MDKPKRKSDSCLDYHQCRNFLQEKYKYDERDYGGKYKFLNDVQTKINKNYGKSWFDKAPEDFTKKEQKAHDEYETLIKDTPEYLDFWHWVCDTYQIHNGCFITFDNHWLEGTNIKEDWIRIIYKYYIDEFANKDGELRMYVWW